MSNLSIKEQLTGKTIFLIKDWSGNILGAFIWYSEAMDFLNKCEDETDEDSGHKYLYTLEEVTLQ
jgi:hypothetical protein